VTGLPAPGGIGEADGVVPEPALSGWRVLIPRPPARASELADTLRAVGAEPVCVALISIGAPQDGGRFDLRLIELARGAFSWVGFTSVNAVDAVLGRAADLGLTPAVPADTRVAAVGPATAAALRSAGLPVDLVPSRAGSAGALASIWPRATAGDSVLLPRSDIAVPGLPDALTAKGYRVEAVTAYRTVQQSVPTELADDLAAGTIDAVLFTSPSTVNALTGAVIAASTVLGAIGEPTTDAAAATGRPVHFTAERPTAGALVNALTEFAQEHPRRVEA